MHPPRSYLFVTWEGGGNVPPVLGTARRLTDRGHLVTVLTEPCLREAVEHIGARFIPFTRHFTRTDRAEDIVRDSEAASPLGALRMAFDNLMFGPCRIVAGETRQAIRAIEPDVLVVDLMMPGALIAGEAAGLPRVVLFHMPEYLPSPGRPAAGPGFLPRTDCIGRLRDGLFTRIFFSQVGRQLGRINGARLDHGLAPFTSAHEIVGMYHSADLRLIQTSEAFDFPITPAPQNVRYVGPVLDEPDWIAEVWQNPWPDDDPRPLVVVSLSSTYQNQREAILRAIAALGKLDVRGLVTLGPAMEKEHFVTPANVVVVRSAPHDQVFARADAVVTHAGHGTVMRTLAHGLPLVCLPMGRDQHDNAARVVAHGMGLRLKPTAGASEIRQAVRRVLGEEDFRMEARRMQRLITADAAADRSVHELENVGCEVIRPPQDAASLDNDAAPSMASV